MFEFSTGLKTEDRNSADLMARQLGVAMRTGEWADWMDDIPTIQKWRAESADGKTGTATLSSAGAIEAWRNHYAASATERQIIEHTNHLQLLASSHDLLTLTPAQAASFFRMLGTTRHARQYSDQIIEIMKDRLLTRPQIIEAMQEAGIEVDRRRLAIALANRKRFELVAKPGHHRTGKYRVVQDGHELSPSTRNKYLQTYQMFYRWAIAQGLVKKNPFAGIESLRVELHAEIIWLNREERDRIIMACEAMSCRGAIWIALYAGLRRGEIARLRWEDVDLIGRWIHVKITKTGKPRRVPISDALLGALQATGGTSGHIVPHWHTGGSDPATKSESDLHVLRRSLPDLKNKIKWNVFRHTFASLLAQTGKLTIDQICAMMGNTPEVCRRHYAHMIPDAVERTGINLID